MSGIRVPRLAIATAAVVMLTLVSSVSHAAWTAGTSATTSASNGTIALSSAGLDTLAHTYQAVDTTKVATVTLSNTGSVALPLTALAIATEGSLPAANVTLNVWVRSGTSCPTAVPTTGARITTALTATSVAIPAGFASVPASASRVLCVATTLAGPLASVAGLSITPTLTFSGRVGTHWTAADSTAARSFTQSVAGTQAPTALSCSAGDGYRVFLVTYDTVVMSWSAPASGADSYRVMRGTTLVATVPGTATSIELNGDQIPSAAAITVRAVKNGVESGDSAAVSVTSTGGFPYILSKNVRCA